MFSALLKVIATGCVVFSAASAYYYFYLCEPARAIEKQVLAMPNAEAVFVSLSGSATARRLQIWIRPTGFVDVGYQAEDGFDGSVPVEINALGDFTPQCAKNANEEGSFSSRDLALQLGREGNFPIVDLVAQYDQVYRQVMVWPHSRPESGAWRVRRSPDTAVCWLEESPSPRLPFDPGTRLASENDRFYRKERGE